MSELPYLEILDFDHTRDIGFKMLARAVSKIEWGDEDQWERMSPVFMSKVIRYRLRRVQPVTILFDELDSIQEVINRLNTDSYKMKPERYRDLSAIDATFTDEEVAEGWHFCHNWDGLQVGPGVLEWACCSCDTGVKLLIDMA